jgi:branched-chain amino acid transport system permease protein
MEQFIQQVASGLANGAIYACVALALVMIYVSTDHINFAQGEMAMFSTYLSWQLMTWGMSFWLAFICAVALSFVMGVLIERLILRPLHSAPVLSIIVVFIGLLAIFNSMAGAIWSYLIKEFPSPFPKSSFGIAGVIGPHQLGVVVVTLIVLGLLFVFFRYTPLGLAMRAAAQNPQMARLVGVRVDWMLALGWGLAASVGAVAGIMVSMPSPAPWSAASRTRPARSPAASSSASSRTWSPMPATRSRRRPASTSSATARSSRWR